MSPRENGTKKNSIKLCVSSSTTTKGIKTDNLKLK